MKFPTLFCEISYFLGFLNLKLTILSGEYGVSVNNVIPGIIYSDTAVQNYGPFGPKMFKEAIKQVKNRKL